ncbi:uncharacterized protein LOC117343714 [Pecten maximus]|uniref:uncharacterized protein LOC117343714 n=1 Tax=Pecten maximus TaxID=6579 RepID=UPI001457E68C|nr:uncharacterized protein LOC117343714 [Pecten maximus]
MYPSCGIFLVTLFAAVALVHPSHLYVSHDLPCHTSADCPLDACCRELDGNLITLSGTFDAVGPFHDTHNGTCVPLLAQHGEHCGEFCQCDKEQGLRCYRHVSDHEFSPSICREKAYVEKQRRNWLSCYKDPKCKLPM